MTSLWKPGGRLWIPSAPSDRIQVDSEGFIRDVNTDDMFPVEVPSIGEVDAVSAKLDEKGIHRPIKDGLDDDGMGTLSAEEDIEEIPNLVDEDTDHDPKVDDDATTDEERLAEERLEEELAVRSSGG